MRHIKILLNGIIESTKQTINHGAAILSRIHPELAVGKSNMYMLSTTKNIQNALVLKDAIDKYFDEVDFFDDPYVDIRFGVYTVHTDGSSHDYPYIVVNGVSIDVGLEFMERFAVYVVNRTKGHVCEFMGNLRNAEISEYDKWGVCDVVLSYNGVDEWELVDGDNDKCLGRCSIREFMGGLNEFFEF